MLSIGCPQAAKSLQVPSDPSRPEGIVDRWQLGHGSDVDSPAPASPVWVLPAQVWHLGLGLRV